KARQPVYLLFSRLAFGYIDHRPHQSGRTPIDRSAAEYLKPYWLAILRYESGLIPDNIDQPLLPFICDPLHQAEVVFINKFFKGLADNLFFHIAGFFNKPWVYINNLIVLMYIN